LEDFKAEFQPKKRPFELRQEIRSQLDKYLKLKANGMHLNTQALQDYEARSIRQRRMVDELREGRVLLKERHSLMEVCFQMSAWWGLSGEK